MISLTSPVRTRAHEWPAALKLAGLCASTPILFFIESPMVLLCIFIGALGLYALPGRRFLIAGFRQLRLIWPFIVVVALWHIWSGEVAEGATVILRLMSTVSLANLLTMTTRLSDMIDVLRKLSHPLKRFGLRPGVLEIAIALVIRLTPVLLQKGAMLSEAWRARSPKRPGWRIILPFTVLALDDAEHVGDALRARGGFNTLE